MSEKIPSLFSEKRDRWHGKYLLPLAFTLSAGAHVGMMFPEKIADAIENAPRKLRAMKNTYGAEKHAKAFVERYAEKLAKHEPLDIDLKNFYLAAEMAAGGISKDEILESGNIFDNIIVETKKLQETESRENVINHLLEQQGEYLESHSHLSDLLRKKKGNCEARQKFLSAAFQAVYPEDVKSGKLKMEIFGAFKDEVGRDHPGHVRAIIDEGDSVTVLEGGMAKRESKEKHADIPSYEVTQMAVKSVAAAQGQYDLQKDAFIAQEEQKGQSKTEKSSGFIFGTDSIAKYPASKQSYRDAERGLSSITPDFLKKERNAIALEIRTGKLSDLMETPEERKAADAEKKRILEAFWYEEPGSPAINMSKKIPDESLVILQEYFNERRREEVDWMPSLHLSHVANTYPSPPDRFWNTATFITQNEFGNIEIVTDQGTSVIDLGPLKADSLTILYYDGDAKNVEYRKHSGAKIETYSISFIPGKVEATSLKIKFPFQQGVHLERSTLQLDRVQIDEKMLAADIGCLDLREADTFDVKSFVGNVKTILLSAKNPSKQEIGMMNGATESIIRIFEKMDDFEVPKMRSGFSKAFTASISKTVLERYLSEVNPDLATMSAKDWQTMEEETHQQWESELKHRNEKDIDELAVTYPAGAKGPMDEMGDVDTDGDGIVDRFENPHEK